ncbi:hypothetical protein [Microlunatus sp. GCM10028923]|uniref:hypothetical protein n=1 Tax=Microlunatus sp. GCM10028923 TaxID=3273400 RepID=UPI0036240B1C
MRFANLGPADQVAALPPADVLVLRGTPPADDGYRWFSTGLGGEQPTVIGFATGALDLHGILSVPARAGRLTAWALRLWRPADQVTIVCCAAELDRLPADQRQSGLRVLIDRLAGFGEGTAVILAGGWSPTEADQLVESGWLARVAPGEDRLLVAPGIKITEHDPDQGTADLAIRHRRQLINERRWTEPGAEVIRLDWWYQPERSVRVRCDSYAEAEERQRTDAMGGGSIALTSLLQNPDGRRLETTNWAGSEAAALRKGALVLSRRFVVHQPQRRTDFDTAAEALRCAWAWDADEVSEELTLGHDPATAVQLPGDRVRIKIDWR